MSLNLIIDSQLLPTESCPAPYVFTDIDKLHPATSHGCSHWWDLQSSVPFLCTQDVSRFATSNRDVIATNRLFPQPHPTSVLGHMTLWDIYITWTPINIMLSYMSCRHYYVMVWIYTDRFMLILFRAKSCSIDSRDSALTLAHPSHNHVSLKFPLSTFFTSSKYVRFWNHKSS